MATFQTPPTKGAFKFHITGIQASLQRLQQFPSKLRRGILKAAGNAGSKIALDWLKANAPKKTGTWKKSLGRKVAIRHGGLRLWYGAGPRTAIYAMVTFNGKGSAMVQGREHRRKNGLSENRDRGRERKVKVGSIGGSVRLLKKSKKHADGTPALFWTDKTGKVRAMPLRQKVWPSKYSHLINNGTKTGGKAYHMFERCQAATQARQEAAVTQSIGSSMPELL